MMQGLVGFDTNRSDKDMVIDLDNDKRMPDSTRAVSYR